MILALQPLCLVLSKYLIAFVVESNVVAFVGKQRCDPADGDTAVSAMSAERIDLQELLTIPLGHEVLRRDIIIVGECVGDSRSALVGQCQVVDIRTPWRRCVLQSNRPHSGCP